MLKKEKNTRNGVSCLMWIFSIKHAKSFFSFCILQYFLFTTGCTGSPGLLDLISKVSSFDRSTRYTTFRFRNQCKACLMHVFWEETSVNWKCTQTQGKRLTYALNILCSCQRVMCSTRVRIDVFARLLDKYKNGRNRPDFALLLPL